MPKKALYISIFRRLKICDFLTIFTSKNALKGTKIHYDTF